MTRKIKLFITFFLIISLFLSCNRGKEADNSRSMDKGEAQWGKSDGSPSLLLITIDTWRWDYIGASGSGKVDTPNLDKLAKEGVYEKMAETPIPLTTPAHTTIMTGLLPLNHGVLDCVGYSLSSSVTTLAEIFKKNGYSTAAFISSETLRPRYGLNKGFDLYDDSGLNGKSENLWDSVSRDGKETTQAMLRYLNATKGDDKQFIWVHYYDLHIPYRIRTEFTDRYPKDEYAQQMAFVDSQVAILLKRTGIDQRKWRIIVVGDHGEGLNDHDEPEHGLSLYTETLNVPLLIYPKPEKELRHKKVWRLEDIFPTICEWYGFDCPKVDGESLFSAGNDSRILPSITIMPTVQFGVNPVMGIRQDNLFYMKHGVEEFYNLEDDPDEKANLINQPKYGSKIKELRNKCNSIFHEGLILNKLSGNIKLSDEDLKKLQSLGYISGSGIPSRQIQKVDIRQVCRDFGIFEKIRLSREPDSVNLEKAYEMIISKYPGATAFYENYGLLLIQKGDYKRASSIFEKALKINPKSTTAMVNLGSLYIMQGNTTQAQILLETALSYDPDNMMIHKNLGIIYSEFQNLPDKAVEHYKKYLELGGTADRNQIIAYIKAHRTK